MIWFLIGPIVGILYEFTEGFRTTLGDYILSALLSFSLGIIPSIILSAVIGFYFPKDNIVKEEKIVSLTDNTSIEGRKYLFSGYINEKYIYRYVTETAEGKQIKELDNSENIYIKYDNNPRIETETYKFKDNWAWLFAIDLSDSKITIYIPEGAITQKYEINLD